MNHDGALRISLSPHPQRRDRPQGWREAAGHAGEPGGHGARPRYSYYIITTEQLAEAYECEPIQIQQNFNNNKGHFEEGEGKNEKRTRARRAD